MQLFAIIANTDEVGVRGREIVERFLRRQLGYNLVSLYLGVYDEYLETFNRPNVTLVDTKGKGIERIVPEGVVVEGHRQIQHPHGGAETPHVAVEQEHPAVVGSDRLVDAFAVQEAVIEHRDDGVGLVQQAAVHVHHCAHLLSVLRVLFCVQLR